MENLFYKKAADYWAKIPPTLEGMLGGFGFISEIDINGSKSFIEEIFSLENPPKKHSAIDCGAGIGRITKNLLIDIFDKVDVLDQNEKFIEVARQTIEPTEKLGSLYSVGLQSFKAEKKYDVIWCQWVLGHLTDGDFIQFFRMCSNSLNENGLIIVKENVTSSGKLEKDETDSSVTRSLKHLLSLIKKSNLQIIKQHKQNDFPQGLYPVYLLALKPVDSLNTEEVKQISNEEQIRNEKEKKDIIQIDDLLKNVDNMTLS